MFVRSKFFIGILLLLIIGCYPVSHIMIGEPRDSLNPADVVVYADFPEKYEKVAIIQASSDFAFKDPSIDFTNQKKTDKALQRLKNEAALLGANGIVIGNLTTIIKQNIHSTDEDISTHNEEIKEIKATAIFVQWVLILSM